MDCTQFVQDVQKGRKTDLSQIDLTKSEGIAQLSDIALGNREALQFCTTSFNKTPEQFKPSLEREVGRFVREVRQIPSFESLKPKEQDKLLKDLSFTIREGDQAIPLWLASLGGGTIFTFSILYVHRPTTLNGILTGGVVGFVGGALTGALAAEAFYALHNGYEDQERLGAYLDRIDGSKKTRFRELEAAFAQYLYKNPDEIDTENLAKAAANKKFHDILDEDGMTWYFANTINHYEQMNLDPLPLVNDRGPAEEERRAQNRAKYGESLAEIKRGLINPQNRSQDMLVALSR
ncbi:MAG: hypothetical protein HYU99_07335 [Deltaproteobacteria bacterium]|nr:hypothetical protein [Deltaproteobacteria bacterium]